MEYIIDRANIVKSDSSFITSSMLVKDNSIRLMKETILSTRLLRMDFSSYVMTPGHVMIVDELQAMNFQQFKAYMTDHYLNRGCTTLLSVFTIQHEREFAERLKLAKSYLLNSPIDYFFAIRVPLNKLTPSLIRLCKRHRLPAVFLEISDEETLRDVAWGWIKESLYQFPIAFIPCLRKTPATSKQIKRTWKALMKEERLPHLIECPMAGKALGKEVLMKLGIYPNKGDLRVGGELNYNLYVYPEDRIIETIEDLDYDSHIPEITVHRGIIQKAGGSISFRPGFGNECTVSVPGHFMEGRR